MPNAIMRLDRVNESREPSEYDDGLTRDTSVKLREESGDAENAESYTSEDDFVFYIRLGRTEVKNTILLSFIGNSRLTTDYLNLIVSTKEDNDFSVSPMPKDLVILQNWITHSFTVKKVKECNNELRILKTMTDLNIFILKKYNVTRQHNPDELADIDQKDLGCDKYKLNKLVSDRNIANTIFVSTYLNLALYKRFDTLMNYNKSILDNDTYRAFLAEDTMNNKIKRRELGKQVRQQRNHIKSVTYDTEQTIEALKGQLEDASLLSEARSRYMDNWQVARTEQNIQTISDKEARPSQIIKYYRQRHDHEARVHSEIEVLTNIRINETLVEVEKWMNKYDKDIESIDLRIQLKKNDYNSQTATRIEMEELYEKHDEEMKAWVKFTTEREAERQYRLKMNTAAIAVQAWWRGLLVRLALGPYKPGKKKQGAKPGDKKKNK